MALSLGGLVGTGGACGCCGGTECVGDCCAPCAPCNIPITDLTLTWDGGITQGAPVTLRYGLDGFGNPQWVGTETVNIPTSVPSLTSNVRWTVQCGFASEIEILYENLTTGAICVTNGGFDGQLRDIDHDCVSFSAHNDSGDYTSAGARCLDMIANTIPIPYVYYIENVYVTGPASFAVNQCCQKFRVTGCGSNGLNVATVEVYDTMGGTLLASGQVDGSGYVTLLWLQDCASSVYIKATASRYDDNTQTATLTAGATTTIAMTVSSGYHCLGTACQYPVSDTLHCSYANAGSKTFTYSAGAWTSSFSYLGDNYVATLTATTGTYTIAKNGVACTSPTRGSLVCYIPGSFAFSESLNSGSCNAALGTGSITE